MAALSLDTDVYRRKIDKRLINLIERPDITKKNQQHLRDFFDWIIENGQSKGTALDYIRCVSLYIRGTKKDLKSITLEDIKAWMRSLNTSDKTDSTKVTYKVKLKRFVKFLKGLHYSRDYPPEVSWIKTRMSNKTKLPEDLLTKKEAMRLIGACLNPRDKALISLLYETGLRIGEALTLQVKSLEFDTKGAHLKVSNVNKTGGRRVLVRNSLPLIQNWLNHHPVRDEDGKVDPEAPFWVTINASKTGDPTPRPYTYRAFSEALSGAKRRARIKKRVHPHLLRHSAATNLAPKVKEFAMKQYFGWTMDSNMPAVYIHLSGKEVDNEILAARGMDIKTIEDPNIFKPIVCANCGAENPPDAKLCVNCHLPPNDAALADKIKKEQMMTSLIELSEGIKGLDERQLGFMKYMVDNLSKRDFEGYAKERNIEVPIP